MSGEKSPLLENLKNLYLKEDQADVWFVFDDERVPGHKVIITSSPWLEAMFYGSLTEKDEVDMRRSGYAAESFKELLRYLYTGKVKFTMDNIENITFSADASLNQGFLNECEKFLLKGLSDDNLSVMYELALRHERLIRLKAICDEKICVNAEQTIRSPMFEKIDFHTLLNILKLDALVCEEENIFNACIAWAKAACVRENMDQHNAQNLRDQLKESIYQIRFSSMTIAKFAKCIQSCPGLFDVDELQEIICMIGHERYSGTMRFNWTQRFFNLRRDVAHELTCDRYDGPMERRNYFSFQRTEVTEFTCSRRALLKGFTCESNRFLRKQANVEIIEKNEENIKVRYNNRHPLEFTNPIERRDNGQHGSISTSYQANVELINVFLLRPGYTYSINITFDTDPHDIQKNCNLKKKVRVDHDIVFRFTGTRQIVSSLTISRFENQNYFVKIVHNQMMWFKFILLLLVITLLRVHPFNFVFILVTCFLINEPDSNVAQWWHRIKNYLE